MFPLRIFSTKVHNVHPLVSVIIPCFNYGRYLSDALNSVVSQSYPNIEIVVIDDGSTDDTRQVAEKYPLVKYVHQTNQGASAARNTGILNSCGDFLVFLDADDWLLPEALTTNVSYLTQSYDLAFVSGAHVNIFPDGRSQNYSTKVESDHYYQLLHGCYIGALGSVMFRRCSFDDQLFDIAFPVAQDYEIFLRIARQSAVQNHTQIISAYRIHSPSQSSDPMICLAATLKILDEQKKFSPTKREIQGIENGKRNMKQYYYSRMSAALNDRVSGSNDNLIARLSVYLRSGYLKFLVSQLFAKDKFKLFIQSYAPSIVLRMIHRAGFYDRFAPPIGEIKMGDFDRIAPFSRDFGFSRGGPVDRFYIETFLEKNLNSIKGIVLEVGDDIYTKRFGGSRVAKSEILHIIEENPLATIVADLSDAPGIPDETFDCIILTQTLQLIYNCKEALETSYRILKPGGTLLLTVPGISQIDNGEWNDYWYWSFTKLSITRLLSEIFPSESVEVKTYGNLLAATAFLYGMGLPELKKEKVEFTDPHYQVIISAVAVKPTGN